ncbi:MAG TPA: VTT domain-containing protein [Oleiagrimonas sp.]|nr:VTT domain-containing protein [Oleiagrimonas sp.]
MRLFGPFYERALVWAAKPLAAWYLAGLSFIEAFIFPIPPEVMLAPMALAKPRKAFRYAHISLVASLLGSLVGYALGHYAFQALSPFLASIGLLAPINEGVAQLREAMNAHWLSFMLVLVLAALQPVVPMKVVTWASGIVGVPLPAFIMCMAIGRAKRVYLLALLIRLFGKRAEEIMHRHVERFGWAVLVLLVALGVWWFAVR